MKTKTNCIKCDRQMKIYAKGMCRTCYAKFRIPKRWSEVSDKCIHCETTTTPHAGHGLCKICYNTKQNAGNLCACGCGQLTSIFRGKERKFIHGHWVRTVKRDSEFLKNLSVRFSGEGNPCYGKFGKDHPAYGHYTPPEVREARRQRRLKALTKKNKKRTSIEITLSNLLDELGLPHNPQALIADKFVVDEYLKQHNLIIEAYGGYWHGDPRRFDFIDLSPLQRKNKMLDQTRAEYFEAGGYKLLILWEEELLNNLDWCKEQILCMIEN